MIKCIIIDDEQFSIDSLLKYIELLPRLQVESIFKEPHIVFEQLTVTENVDLIFMDIDMPHISGIELAKAVRHKTDKLVFTTSHSKYAFDAFEVDADAFLLKPFSFIKFSRTINRLFPNEPVAVTNSSTENTEDYFLVKNKDEDLRIVKVKFKDVIASESFHNHIKIHLSGNKIITAYLTTKDIETLLASRFSFKQFHRAFIIATDCINYIQGNTIRMTNNLTFTVGESYRTSFNQYMSEKLLMTSRKR